MSRGGSSMTPPACGVIGEPLAHLHNPTLDERRCGTTLGCSPTSPLTVKRAGKPGHATLHPAGAGRQCVTAGSGEVRVKMLSQARDNPLRDLPLPVRTGRTASPVEFGSGILPDPGGTRRTWASQPSRPTLHRPRSLGHVCRPTVRRVRRPWPVQAQTRPALTEPAWAPRAEPCEVLM